MATAASGITAGGLSVKLKSGSPATGASHSCSCSSSICPSSTSRYLPSCRDGRWPVNKSSGHRVGSSSGSSLTSQRFVCHHRPEGSRHGRGATAAMCSRTYSFVRRIRLDTFLPLVDSRDIVELELKHKDYEITIRKKEALESNQPPPQPFPSAMVSSLVPQPAYPAPPPPAPYVQPTAPPAEAPPPPAAAEPVAPAPPPPALAPSHVICSPMAGTFYRSPAPGESAFVKVGDMVKKGQPICIVEAMKLMNEIEADQGGVIAEILVEDGKPVAVDTPLFALKQ
ncbi:hypothetical protein CBR_g50847 [Chara braunii]|uniref:Biotin carboxyl carrier protein of acetyl-CoA carboxylase n=1 Tax=Chara braunii TaxID=69332 RepID=A0A388M7H9_CHABU|nr:hypothetical protein CBR_g50847 [Chara braunii]|eukprot:GBG90500.1 hypothetical protein CBR_g50847 [Chara braunii]